MRLCIILLLDWTVSLVLSSSSHNFPPFPGSRSAPSICRYCLCDRHTATVTCTGERHLQFRVISLPEWAETFQAHNLSLVELPHFTYQPTLRILRINFCQLRYVHPLALAPLPNVETLHLADNWLETLPEAFLQRANRLRILNLARNHIEDLGELEWSLPTGLVLDQIILDGNPVRKAQSAGGSFPWPLAKQLHLANLGIESISQSGVIFRNRGQNISANHSVGRSLTLPEPVWQHLEVLDLSGNAGMRIEQSALPHLANVSTLKLSEAHIHTEMLRWFELPSTKCRHLELRDARIDFPKQSDNEVAAHFGAFSPPSLSRRQWAFCAPSLEWLDVSGTEIESLEVHSYCRIKWLFANRNRLDTVRIQSATLRTLEVEGNRLRQWPLATTGGLILNSESDFGDIFSPFKQLETVSFANNTLEDLPADWLSWLPALQHLDLSQNKMLSLFHPVLGQPKPRTNSQLRYLNLSGNSLRAFPGLSAPTLTSLAVLDLSSNALHSIGTDLFEKLPEIQHLHLSNNPTIGSFSSSWLLSQSADSTPLRSLDMSGCGLLAIPNVSRLRRLTSLRLNANYLAGVENLPPCLAHIELRDNRLQQIGNISSSQMECLKEMDVGLNPLLCDCSLSPFADILRQQPLFEDRSEYYCFEDDWQHSLKAYLESSFDFCESFDSKRGGGLLNVATRTAHLLEGALLIIAGAAAMAFALLKVHSAFGGHIALFAYKPVPQTETPVSV